MTYFFLYQCRIKLWEATFSGGLNITILVAGNPSIRVPVPVEGRSFHEDMEFLFEVNKSSVHPKVSMIAIEVKGCNNTEKTQSVSMRTKALEMPKITIDPLERINFLEKVISQLVTIKLLTSLNVALNICRYKA